MLLQSGAGLHFVHAMLHEDDVTKCCYSQEQAFISSMLHEDGGIYWFDLNDRDSPGSYKFTDGSSPQYTHWGINQPGEPPCAEA